MRFVRGTIVALLLATVSPAFAAATDRGDYVSIDVGGTFIKATRFSRDGRALKALRIPTPDNRDPDAIIAALKRVFATVRGSAKVAKLAVGMPGPVDGTERVMGAPNLDDAAWKNGGQGIDLQGRLARELEVPTIVVENDAVMASHDRSLLGSSTAKQTKLWITLGTGFGAVLKKGPAHLGTELAHHPWRLGKGNRLYTYEQDLGNAALRAGGIKRWLTHLEKALFLLDKTFGPRQILIAGGNAKHLADPRVLGRFRVADKIVLGSHETGTKGGYHMLRKARPPRRSK